jgi:putative PIN family toxin of toxin-antitoxin system
VIDTNVIVSALVRPSGRPAEVVNAARGGALLWITSLDLIKEAQRVLLRPHIRRLIEANEDAIADLFLVMNTVAMCVTPTRQVSASRDPDDNRVLEAAVAGEADYIVTGDRDLLELASYEGIRIVTPADFVELLPH